MMMGMMMVMILLPFVIIAGLLCLPFAFRWRPAGWAEEIPVPKRKRQMIDLSSAQQILEERYAQGEISREEYLEMRNDVRR
jgi:uncharacterized membrane protein